MKRQRGLTQRAPDWRDSAPFSGFFLRPNGILLSSRVQVPPAQQFDPTAHEDEYVSAATFPEGVADKNKVVNRGAFLDRNPYTRLITYSNLNDLRATNETFDKLTDYPKPEPRPGPKAMEQCGANDPDPECVLY
jgi:hypothetical protein